MREHAAYGDLDCGDVAVPAELGHESTSGLQRAIHARQHRIVVAHPVQRGVRKHRVELAVERQSLRIHHTRVESSRPGAATISSDTSTPDDRRARRDDPSPSASPLHSRDRVSARRAAGSATPDCLRRAPGRRRHFSGSVSLVQRFMLCAIVPARPCAAALLYLARSESALNARFTRHIHARHADGREPRRRRRDLSRLGAPRAGRARARRLQRPPARDDASLLTRDARDTGADSSRACATATATCSTSSATAAKGRNATRTRASCRRRFPSECIIRKPDFPGTRAGSSRRVSRFRHLPAPCRHVLHAEPAAQGRHVSRRRAQDSVSGRARRDGDPAPADPGVPDRVQPRLQRHRLLLARDGFRGRGRRARRRMSRR